MTIGHVLYTKARSLEFKEFTLTSSPLVGPELIPDPFSWTFVWENESIVDLNCLIPAETYPDPA